MTDCPFQPSDTVAAYLRDSGGDDQDLSVAQQLTEVRAWCASNKLALTITFTDEAKGGSTTVGRDNFWQMIHHFHNGATEKGILIWRTNRFGRNINDSQYYKADLRRLGFIVHSLKDIIPEGSAGQLIEFALDWKDQVFIEQLSEDVKRGLRHLVQVYGCVPGTPPRGFMRERIVIGKRRDGTDHIGHRWIPDPEMIPLIIRAFEMRAKGDTIPHIRAATGLYTSSNSYTTFFNNPLYIGTLQFADIIITDYCPPVIDRQTWDEVQRIGQRRKLPQINIDHPRRVSSSFMLSGLLYCQQCGSPLSGYSIADHDYYDCSRRRRKHDCTARRIPRIPIEQEVLRIITDRMLSLDFLLVMQTEIQNAWAEQSQQTDRARREIEKQLHGIQNKIRNITRAISEHGHSRALLNQLEGLELQENDARAELGKLEREKQPAIYTPAQLSDLASQLTAELQSDDIKQKRSTLRGLIARIVAQRTDDKILGVVYINQVNGNVPPWGHYPNTLFRIEVKIRKYSRK